MGVSESGYIGMRRFIFLSFFLIILITFFICNYEGREEPLVDRLERDINCAGMNSYREKFYGYVVHYPSFFEKIQDSMIHKLGCCQFRFWNIEKILQTVSVIPDLDNFTIQQEMDCTAVELHATEQYCDSNYFILSGPFYDKEEELKKYSFHAKYVRHQKLWFIQSLVYPEEYSKAVVRLINLIDNWQVWENEKPLLPERLQLPPQITSRRKVIKIPNIITLY